MAFPPRKVMSNGGIADGVDGWRRGEVRPVALGHLDFIRGREHQEDDAVLAGGPLVDDFVVLVVQAEGVGNVVPRVAAVISAAVISTAAARDHDGDGRYGYLPLGL